MNTIEQTNAHIMQTYGRSDVVLDNGTGATIHDAGGKTFIDFGSGIGTASLGYCNQAWADAVCEQVRKIQHTSNLFYHEPQAKLAEKLCAMTGYEKMFVSAGKVGLQMEVNPEDLLRITGGSTAALTRS